MSTERSHHQPSFLTPADAEMVELMRYFVREAGRIYATERPARPSADWFINSPRDAYDLLRDQMEHLRQEEFRVLTLTTKQQVISTPTVYVGNLGSAIVRPAEVFRPAIIDAAASIVVAHNHPSGDPSPSPEDVHVTRRLAEAGRLLDIELLDHVVIGDGEFVSMRERGLIAR